MSTLDETSPVLDAVRGATVSHLFVEFLQQGAPKPHVVLRLVLDPAVYVGNEYWSGCRLAMDYNGGDTGDFTITPLRYTNPSHAATASFEFTVKNTAWTVNNYIAVLTAEHNMTNFNFVGGFYQAGSSTEYYDGCRDFISQFFIQLHRWGVVGWTICRVDRGLFDDTNLRIRLDRTGFHEIIGRNFQNNPRGSNRPTLVTDLPLARGEFLEPDFHRNLTHVVGTANPRTYRLPYWPSEPQEGDAEYGN